MKILLVNGTFYPDTNGTITYVVGLALELKKQGHQVSILCGGRKIFRTFEGINMFMFRKPPIKLDLNKKYECYRRRFDEKLKEIGTDFDLIISKTDLFLNQLKGVFNSKKIIFVSPGLHDITKSIGYSDALTIKRRRKEIQEGICGLKIITLSKVLERQFKENFELLKIISIPPGINLKKVEFEKEKQNNLLYVGRVYKEKNANSIIKSLSLIKQGRLILVGGGKELDEIKDYAKKLGVEKRIDFVGFVQNPEEFYFESKVFLFPSKYEPFGLTILEAFAAGLPVIAFRPDGKKIITASDEIIVDGKTGFLVKDEKEMAEKIDLLLKDDKLREKMGKAARKVAEKYSWEKAAKEILKFAKQQT